MCVIYERYTMPDETYLITAIPEEYLRDVAKRLGIPLEEFAQHVGIDFYYSYPKGGMFTFTNREEPPEYVPTDLLLRLWDVLRQHYKEEPSGRPIYIPSTWSVKDVLYLDPADAYKKRYSLRRAVRKAVRMTRTLTTSIPPEVVEKAARKRSLTVDEFIARYDVEFLYDGIEGGFFRFVEKGKAR